MHRIHIVNPSLLLLLSAIYCGAVFGLGDPAYVSEGATKGAFPLVQGTDVASLYIDSRDHKGVQRALTDLQADIQRVSGQQARIVSQREELGRYAVIVGTIGSSALVDELIAAGKLDPSAILGKWEGFHLEVVEQPLAGVERALVIAGADRRGTTYGIYDVSEHIGVSPWYYWADVPIARKDNIFIAKNTRVQQAPTVKYRGIFLNDEAPALTSWVQANHGDYTHEFYVKVFELLLRLKANFLWPAMWNNAFADDDPQNMILADEYGIVMSTSHHEPMMRADKEWNRYGKGPWEYSTNAENIYQFWQEGAQRNKLYENIYTVGMRGQEDKPMSEGENIGLLEKIVHDQREILAHVFTDRDVSEVPQVWCLYKEVQGFYERGMRVPEDIILLWADDNWGNIRRLPSPQERQRSGGAGVYYHFDYVGGPRSYRWINTTPLAKVQEQMHLAWTYDATQIWIVNVGDLKPMEVPIEFFLRMAWNPERWGRENIQEFGRLWATREFGAQHAAEIESLITAYTRHNGRRKPELMEPGIYSVLHYDEAARIDQEMQDMLARAEALYKKMPADKKDAFFQLVLHPVKATATVTRMYIAVARNQLYAQQGRATANRYADLAKKLFAEDARLEEEYHSINNGKWNGFMSQSHIGYRSWRNPQDDQMPMTYEYTPGAYAEIGVAVAGEASAWPARGIYELNFDQAGQQQRVIDIFNRGTEPFEFNAVASAKWLKISDTRAQVKDEHKLKVSIVWDALPVGASQAYIDIQGTDWLKARVRVNAFKHPRKLLQKAKGFIEADGYLSIEAANFSKSGAVEGIAWREIPQHGRTQSSISTYPAGDKSFSRAGAGPWVEYPMTFTRTGEVEVQLLLAPTWPLIPGQGLRYAIAIGKQEAQVVHPLENFKDTDAAWEETVRNGVRIASSKHVIDETGPTTLRIYMMDPAVTVQKIVVDSGGLQDSYLGPPQSTYK